MYMGDMYFSMWRRHFYGSFQRLYEFFEDWLFSRFLAFLRFLAFKFSKEFLTSAKNFRKEFFNFSNEERIF